MDQATMLTDHVHIQVWDLSPRRAAPYLEGAAGAGLTQPDDAVQIVGGDGLILLLDETERGEVEAGLLAVSIFQHGGQLIDGAPDSQEEPHDVCIHVSVGEIQGEDLLTYETNRLKKVELDGCGLIEV